MKMSNKKPTPAQLLKEAIEAMQECITSPNAHCLEADTRDALVRRIEAINTSARTAIRKAKSLLD